MSEPRVMIGVPTLEFAKQASFYDAFDLLIKPEGSIITRSHGQSPARGRNVIIEEAIKRNCTHMFFVDDDVILRQNTLIQLLSHDVDMVTGLYTMRNFPHQPIIFDVAMEDGRCAHRYLKDGDGGLIPVVASGLGCCLIKMKVFLNMEPPWVRLGELEIDHWCDDIGFFRRARAAGFQLFCDLEVPVGHMASVTVWPSRTPNGEWMTAYDTSGTEVIRVRQIKTHQEAQAKKIPLPIWAGPFVAKDNEENEKRKAYVQNGQIGELIEK